jgi:hypothetical protein
LGAIVDNELTYDAHFLGFIKKPIGSILYFPDVADSIETSFTTYT